MIHLMADFAIKKYEEWETRKFQMMTRLMEKAIIKFSFYIRPRAEYCQLWAGCAFAAHLTSGIYDKRFLFTKIFTIHDEKSVHHSLAYDRQYKITH